ncbi:MAG: hypothetical protein HQL97_01030 [Magnetococcales bacterium]|nr:hypothetical protein [Magnetococcales bacterium]
MALRPCSECKHQISDTAPTCQQCGAKQKKKDGCIYTTFKVFIAIIGFGIISAIVVPKVSPLSQEAQEAASRSKEQNKPLTEEEKKAQEKKNAEEEKRNQQLTNAETAAKALKQAMKNPDAFQLEEAVVMDDGSACYSYRSRNSFNAVVPGHAVFIPPLSMLTNSDGDKFKKAWNKRCTNKSGTNIAAHINRFGL